AARATKCLNNLRQIGNFYVMYADMSDDRIPLGVTAAGLPYPTIETIPGASTSGGYPVALNHYIWVQGQPSAAAGPLLASGIVKPNDGRFFYCPMDDHGKAFAYNSGRNPWPLVDGKLAEGEGIT